MPTTKVTKAETDSTIAPTASPAFTGVPTAPTAAPGTSTTQLATTAFVQDALLAGGSVASFDAVLTSDSRIYSKAQWGLDPVEARLSQRHITGAPAGVVQGSQFSPDGRFFAISHITTPFIGIYENKGTSYERLPNPASLPTANGYAVGWSKNMRFLAHTQSASPFINIYERTGTTFNKLANPATLPTGNSRRCAFSSNGRFLAVTHAVSPFVTIYEINGTTFTKLANPSVLPTGDAWGVDFSADGKYMAVAHNVAPFLTIYSISDNTFTKIPDPAVLPTSAGLSCSFTSDSQFLAFGENNSPFIRVYSISTSGVFTSLTISAPQGGFTYDTTWSDDGKYLMVPSFTSPYYAIWERVGTTFNRLANLSQAPATTVGHNSISISPDGRFIYMGAASPSLYETKLNPPSIEGKSPKITSVIP